MERAPDFTCSPIIADPSPQFHPGGLFSGIISYEHLFLYSRSSTPKQCMDMATFGLPRITGTSDGGTKPAGALRGMKTLFVVVLALVPGHDIDKRIVAGGSLGISRGNDQ